MKPNLIITLLAVAMPLQSFANLQGFERLKTYFEKQVQIEKKLLEDQTVALQEEIASLDDATDESLRTARETFQQASQAFETAQAYASTLQEQLKNARVNLRNHEYEVSQLEQEVESLTQQLQLAQREAAQWDETQTNPTQDNEELRKALEALTQAEQALRQLQEGQQNTENNEAGQRALEDAKKQVVLAKVRYFSLKLNEAQAKLLAAKDRLHESQKQLITIQSAFSTAQQDLRDKEQAAQTAKDHLPEVRKEALHRKLSKLNSEISKCVLRRIREGSYVGRGHASNKEYQLTLLQYSLQAPENFVAILEVLDRNHNMVDARAFYSRPGSLTKAALVLFLRDTENTVVLPPEGGNAHMQISIQDIEDNNLMLKISPQTGYDDPTFNEDIHFEWGKTPNVFRSLTNTRYMKDKDALSVQTDNLGAWAELTLTADPNLGGDFKIVDEGIPGIFILKRSKFEGYTQQVSNEISYVVYFSKRTVNGFLWINYDRDFVSSIPPLSQTRFELEKQD